MVRAGGVICRVRIKDHVFDRMTKRQRWEALRRIAGVDAKKYTFKAGYKKNPLVDVRYMNNLYIFMNYMHNRRMG